jgi:hypothetical protein
MREVHIYIEAERLELFQDEIIQINSSVQNVQDIAKVFTDFTQSFTVPASERNNAIFKHFYESAIDSNLDHQIRRTARIEIDLIPFRTGKIQLEKSNVKKGRVESYTVTFYGDIRTLQDYFGEDKLNTLDLSQYTGVFLGTDVKTRITSNADYDIRYPLISSKRTWTYGDNASTDISKNSHHIHYDELFPAIRVARLFDAIENRYNINFEGIFLTDKRFTNLYLWLKNKDKILSISNEKQIELISYLDGNYQLNNAFDFTENAIILTPETLQTNTLAIFTNSIKVKTSVRLYAPGVTGTLYLDVYENGSLITTKQQAISSAGTPTTTSYLRFEKFDTVNDSLNKKYTYKIRSAQNCTVGVKVGITLYQFGIKGYFLNCNCEAPTFNMTLDINNNLPDMKISDFVSGVLKQFNLTCTPLSNTSFKIEPLENWYSQGRLIDVTEHIDVDSIDVERTKLYKKIDFKRQKSETILNRTFGDANFREYGDLQQVYEYDGSEYTIEVPFENILHQKFTGTDLQVGYSLDKNLNPIIPKPTLLYMNDQKTCSFYFNDGLSTTLITSYMPFGQDLTYNGSVYTLNFGWDNSSFYLEPIDNNIYMTYYDNYLSNLYSQKQRITYCKGLFPTPILTSLKMNDRLIIRDKRYIINDIKTNLNTGDVDLTLLYDFRQLAPPNIIVPPLDSVYKELFELKNGVKEIIFDSGTTGITITPSSLTQDGIVTITMPAKDPAYTIIAENSDDFITEDTLEYLLSEENDPITYTINIQELYNDGKIDLTNWIITH